MNLLNGKTIEGLIPDPLPHPIFLSHLKDLSLNSQVGKDICLQFNIDRQAGRFQKFKYVPQGGYSVMTLSLEPGAFCIIKFPQLLQRISQDPTLPPITHLLPSSEWLS